MNKEEIAFLTISDQAELIKSGRLSPVELVKIYLERIERWDGILCAWTFICSDDALAHAKALEDEITAGKYRGILHGIPFGVKDQMMTKGVPTSLASKIKSDFGSEKDATVVRKLKGPVQSSLASRIYTNSEKEELTLSILVSRAIRGIQITRWRVRHQALALQLPQVCAASR